MPDACIHWIQKCFLASPGQMEGYYLKRRHVANGKELVVRNRFVTLREIVS